MGIVGRELVGGVTVAQLANWAEDNITLSIVQLPTADPNWAG